jgi:hypothetical protein
MMKQKLNMVWCMQLACISVQAGIISVRILLATRRSVRMMYHINTLRQRRMGRGSEVLSGGRKIDA